LVVASERADPKLVDLLLKAGADPNARSAMGETSLDWALKFGNPAIIARLREAGAQTGDPYVPPVLHRPQSTPTPEQAIRKSLPLLQRSSTEFLKQSGCVGCHHQPITARAVQAAKSAGIAIDEGIASDQHKAIRLEWASLLEELRQGIEIGGATDRLTQSMLGLRAYDPRPDAVTDTVGAEIASAQLSDGRWHFGGVSRAPINESEIGRTAQALRVLQLYALPGRKAEFEERIARARAWLLASVPLNTDDYTMRLLGLYWSGAEQRRVREAASQLIGLQREDGGWAGNRFLESDAYSTAEALVALHETGAAPAGSAVDRRGAGFLLNTQNEDGSWYVRSRAVKFQPYFQSGFPFDHDQWISASATAWAVMALAPSVTHAGATAQNR
ncbi:MAG TPA: prenyltransferase/squalene oxidase repeat-containing protein, partial [Bryobacteraceae bacterium]|nr:prenyltransferase/squalene oxidase repeat-containing protein [Bryobacteraceae bacterium]